ncbi:MAG: hypothetical protein ACI91R_000085 [Vicingaceae bacterium]|jgi:hypothetical protein
MFQAAGRLAKSNSIKWTERFVLPNKSFKEKFNIVQPLSTLPEFEIPKHWKTYQDALAKINIYCDSNGIVVKHTSLTRNKYLEVYGWEEMLRSETHKDLETAKEMQKLGYLDCYAFLTCFHDDFYQQYQHFVKNNKKRLEDTTLKLSLNLTVTSYEIIYLSFNFPTPLRIHSNRYPCCLF